MSTTAIHEHALARTVDELFALVEEQASKTMPGGTVLRAVLPHADGWVAIFDQRSIQFGGATSPDVPPVSVASAAGVIVHQHEDGCRVETVHLEDDAELPAARALLAGQVDGDWTGGSSVHAATLCAYRPRRRAQIRLRLDHGSVYAKVLRRRAWGRVMLRHRCLASVAAARCSFATPELIDALPEERLLVCGDVNAPSLLELLAQPAAVEHVHSAGAALRSLHTAPAEDGDRHDIRSWGPNLDWLSAFRAGLLGLDDRAAAGALELATDVLRVLPASGERAVIHGDFYDKQILCGERVTFLDADTLAIGDPAIDVGNALAHLRLRVLQGRAPAGADALCRAFLAGYSGPAGGDFDRATLASEAASLARLAAIYALRPRWRHLSAELGGVAGRLAHSIGREINATR